MPRCAREIERVAAENYFRPRMSVYEPGEIGADSPRCGGTEMRVTDDEERSIENGHVANTDDKSDEAP
jgi:hypothetical protein